MAKSLAESRIEKSSASDVKNIQWTKKDPSEHNKSKKNNKTSNKKSSASNIIYVEKIKNESIIKKNFKIKENTDKSENNNNKTGKKFQKASASNSKIKKGFKRPGR